MYASSWDKLTVKPRDEGDVVLDRCEVTERWSQRQRVVARGDFFRHQGVLEVAVRSVDEDKTLRPNSFGLGKALNEGERKRHSCGSEEISAIDHGALRVWVNG